MKNCVALILISFIAASPIVLGQTTTTVREQVQQLTSQLQQSPSDQSLREKIIALALTLNPKPTVPDAAIMAEGAAEYAFKNAKTNSDFSDAAKQYEKALLLAPWLAADYFNCGVAHEKAGENKEAIRSFRLYLLAAPDADDAIAVKKRIGGLQFAAEKNEDAASEQTRAANDRARLDARQAIIYRGLDGGVWRCSNLGDVTYYLEIHGHEITMFYIMESNSPSYRLNPQSRDVRHDMYKITFDSRQIDVDLKTVNNKYNDDYSSYKITISNDGQSITVDDVRRSHSERFNYLRVK